MKNVESNKKVSKLEKQRNCKTRHFCHFLIPTATTTEKSANNLFQIFIVLSNNGQRNSLAISEKGKERARTKSKGNKGSKTARKRFPKNLLLQELDNKNAKCLVNVEYCKKEPGKTQQNVQTKAKLFCILMNY